MMKYIKSIVCRPFLSLFGVTILLCAWSGAALSQPLADSLKALQMRNDKMYRELNAADPDGQSYSFTNVTAWKITDEDLQRQLEQVFRATASGEKKLKDIDISRIYVFAAPLGGERFEPFHVLFIGTHVQTDTGGGGGDFIFGTKKSHKGSAEQHIAFQGKEVVRLMLRQPSLFDNINAIQGEIFEMPGDILPSGVQLVKSSTQRYIFHQMFEGFFSKRQIIDEQNRSLGLPTSDESFAAPDTTGNAPTTFTPPQDPEEETTPALPDDQMQTREFRYGKTIDFSANHLLVNVSKTADVEVQLGYPEVGLPFWSAGEGRLWLDLKDQVGVESDFKLGFDFPLNLGGGSSGLFQARALSGSFGGSLAAYFAGIDFFSGFNMPVAFNFTLNPAGGYNSSIIYNGGATSTTSANGTPYLIPANRTFYRTAMVGQFYIPIIVQLDPTNFFQFSAGVGLLDVYRSWIPNASDTKSSAFNRFNPIASSQQDNVQDIDLVSTPVTPHIGLEYVNDRSSKLGLGLYYDHLFTFSAWIELIEDHLRLETSYSAPFVRDPKPYEPSYFFMITPRFYF